MLRSPTAALVLHEEFGFNCRAAGMAEEYCLIPVTEALIFWADEIVFMEEVHLHTFRHIWEGNEYADSVLEDNRFKVLNVPDTFGWNNPELKGLILESYNNQ